MRIDAAGMMATAIMPVSMCAAAVTGCPATGFAGR